MSLPFVPLAAGTTSIYNPPGGSLLAKESLFCFKDTAMLSLTSKKQKHKVYLDVTPTSWGITGGRTCAPHACCTLIPVLEFYLPVLLGQLSLKAALIIAVRYATVFRQI